jgi:hypothetical protein
MNGQHVTPITKRDSREIHHGNEAAIQRASDFGNTPSIFRMIRSAHRTAAATSDSVCAVVTGPTDDENASLGI